MSDNGTNNFSPWKSYELDLSRVPYEIPIIEPPCKECANFNPRRCYDDPGSLKMTGLKLCHAKEMHHDFSCYIAKPKSNIVNIGDSI